MQRFWTFLSLFLAVTVCANSYAQTQKTFAPGVLKLIPSELSARDSVSLPLVLPGVESVEYGGRFVSARDTLFGQTRGVVLFRDVWQYEIAFLPLRQANLRVQATDGTRKYKNYWYMVYRIRNTGTSLSYDQVKEDPRFEHLKSELKRDAADFVAKEKFIPRFSLEGWTRNETDYSRVTYGDRIEPGILAQIQQLEDPNTRLLDTYQIMKTKFNPIKTDSDPGVWGVAIWTDVNPTLDYVSVYVKGLSNSYRVELDSAGNPSFLYKTLQLNFWRPGDMVGEHQDKIKYGIPLLDNPQEQIEICKRYQLPGPLVRGYLDSKKADQNVLVIEVDGQIELEEFRSMLSPDLDKGQLPESVASAFERAGISVPGNVQVKTSIPGTKWSFQVDVDGEIQKYILRLEPQFWERDFEGIRFLKSLDHLWIYR